MLVLAVRLRLGYSGGAGDLRPAGIDARRDQAVQVKTTTYYGKSGWQVVVGRRPYSEGNRKGLVPYDPELIDWFFIVDGDLALYLIPSKVIAGRVGILLRLTSPRERAPRYEASGAWC